MFVVKLGPMFFQSIDSVKFGKEHMVDCQDWLLHIKDEGSASTIGSSFWQVKLFEILAFNLPLKFYATKLY